MKRTCITVFLLIWTFGLWAAADDSQSGPAWESLGDIKLIQHHKLYSSKMHKGGKRYLWGYELELSPIRKVLEQAGVSETVTIEVRYRSKLLERLGTYKPKVKLEGDRQVVNFDSIPDEIRVYRNLASIKVDYHMDPLLQLVFKDSKGKIKARLRVDFVITGN